MKSKRSFIKKFLACLLTTTIIVTNYSVSNTVTAHAETITNFVKKTLKNLKYDSQSKYKFGDGDDSGTASDTGSGADTGSSSSTGLADSGSSTDSEPTLPPTPIQALQARLADPLSPDDIELVEDITITSNTTLNLYNRRLLFGAQKINIESGTLTICSSEPFTSNTLKLSPTYDTTTSTSNKGILSCLSNNSYIKPESDSTSSHQNLNISDIKLDNVEIHSTYDELILTNSTITGRFFKISTIADKKIVMKNNSINIFQFKTDSTQSSNQIKSKTPTQDSIIDSTTHTLKNIDIYNYTVTTGDPEASSKDKSINLINSSISGNFYTLNISKGTQLNLYSDTQAMFTLSAHINDNSSKIKPYSTSSVTEQFNTDLSSDSSKLEGLEMSNLILDLGSTTDSTLSYCKLTDAFKINIEEGKKLHFTQKAKELFIFEPSSEKGYIQNRSDYTDPSSIEHNNFDGVEIKDLHIDVGENADKTIAKSIKNSIITGSEDHEISIKGYNLIKQIPKFENTQIDYGKIYAKLTTNETLSTGDTISIIADTTLDMQNNNITFKNNGKIQVQPGKEFTIQNDDKKIFIFSTIRKANGDVDDAITGTIKAADGKTPPCLINSLDNELRGLEISNLDMDIGTKAANNIKRKITNCEISGYSSSQKSHITGYPLLGQNLIVSPAIDTMLHNAELLSFLEMDKTQLKSHITIDSDQTIELQAHDLLMTDTSFTITQNAKLIIKSDDKYLFTLMSKDDVPGYLSIKPKINGEFRYNPCTLSGLILKDLDIIPFDMPVTISNSEVYSNNRDTSIGNPDVDDGAPILKKNLIIFNSILEAKPGHNLELYDAKLSGTNNIFNNITANHCISDNLFSNKNARSPIDIKGNVTFSDVTINNVTTPNITTPAISLVTANSSLTLKDNSSITNTKDSKKNKAIDLSLDTTKDNVGIKVYDNTRIENLSLPNSPKSDNSLFINSDFLENDLEDISKEGKIGIIKKVTNYAGDPKNHEWVNTKKSSLNLDNIKNYPDTIISCDPSSIENVKQALLNKKIDFVTLDWLNADKNLIGNAKANIKDMTTLYVDDNKVKYGMYKYDISFEDNYKKAIARCINEGSPLFNKKITCTFNENPTFSPTSIDTYKKNGKTTFYTNLEEFLDKYDVEGIDNNASYFIKDNYILYPLNRTYKTQTLDAYITNNNHKGMIEALRKYSKIDNTGTNFADVNTQYYKSTLSFTNASNTVNKLTNIKNLDYITIDISNAYVNGGEQHYLDNINSSIDFDSNNILKASSTAKFSPTNLVRGKIYVEAAKSLNNDSSSSLSVDVFYYPLEEQYPILTKQKSSDTNRFLLLKEGSDYAITKNEKKNDDTYSITIEGMGRYYGKIDKEITLSRCIIKSTYTSSNQTAIVPNAVSYSTDNGNNWTASAPYYTKADTHVFQVRTSSKIYTVQYIISPCTIKLTWSGSKYTYDGKKHAPTISKITDTTEKLNKNDITLTIYKKSNNKYSKVSNATSAGNYKIVATLKGDNQQNYVIDSSSQHTFTIQPKDISKKISLTYSKTLAYTGSTKYPALTVKYGKTKLKSGTDYTLTKPKTAKKVGTYEIKITLKNNYKGSKKFKYSIKYDIRKCKISATRKNGKLNLTIKNGKTKLKYKTDYTYKTSKIKGSYKIKLTITGKGKYAFSKSFNI